MPNSDGMPISANAECRRHWADGINGIETVIFFWIFISKLPCPVEDLNSVMNPLTIYVLKRLILIIMGIKNDNKSLNYVRKIFILDNNN